MTQSLKSPEASFTPVRKARAFCKGLLSGAPLVEVACAGLREGVPEALQEEYAARIEGRISADEAGDILLHGITSQKAELALSRVIRGRGGEGHAFPLLLNRLVSSDEAQRLLAETVHDGFTAYVLLKCRTITSHAAEETLARALRESGLSERAADLLLGGEMLTDAAKLHVSHIVPGDHATLSRLILHEGLPHEVRASLSRRMPRACTPL
jgi:hypothetical protein